MRRLYPEPAGEVDLAEAYAVDGDHAAAHVRVNMVSSIDGAASIDGRVGALTGPADQRLLRALRALADVVLVGAGTVRAEGYGTIALPERWRRLRVEQGSSPDPRLALVSRRLDLDLAAPVFTDPVVPPIVLTTAASSVRRRTAVAEVAEVVVVGEVGEVGDVGDAYVDLAAALGALGERGLRRVLSEGGPRVLSQLLAGGLVDEMCLTVSPLVVGGHDLAISSGPGLSRPQDMRLARVHEEDGYLFLRYQRG